MVSLLKEHFGFDGFRPLQREIITSVLDGKDTFALLPTGAGKSLCYQLPALATEGLTVVVSPLIALMKDQVDSLDAAGIPATFLNSSLSRSESSERVRGLWNGVYRLLYVAPERLMLPDFLDQLDKWNVCRFAIDEAHCISEWGHDFRPEYRQLGELRTRFPNAGILALTATATQRVREDIISGLKLKDARTFIGSFNRPNLQYAVKPRKKGDQQVLDVVRRHAGESGIVYCFSRAATENLASFLKGHQIKAAAYHAGLEDDLRHDTQDAFIKDNIDVICATVAFGMGIDKPNVRYVIHYHLPRNIEGYYQETGRAGRDGLESECLLLMSAADEHKYRLLWQDGKSPHEREVALNQLRDMTHFAESADCRRERLLAYFDEVFKDIPCGACDNCLAPKTQIDGTRIAQMLMSCVFRVKEHSGFAVGLRHLVEVLTGGNTEKIRQWGHETLTTYGIGKEHSREAWMHYGRELMRKGLIHQDPDQFHTVQLTAEGMQFLKERKSIQLTEPAKKDAAGTPSKDPAGSEYDLVLFDVLRALRKSYADEKGVPAYAIFSDVALRQMSAYYPQDLQSFGRLSGVGNVKLEAYGQAFIQAIQNFLRDHPEQTFSNPPALGSKPKERQQGVSGSVFETLRLFNDGMDVDAIAETRGFKRVTIEQHLTQAVEENLEVRDYAWFTDEEAAAMEQAFTELGDERLAPVREHLNQSVSYLQLNIYRAMRNKKSQ